MATSLSVARVIALLAPAGLLGGALISQYAGGLAPCEMCMWQRWPHLIAIAYATIAIGLRKQPELSAIPLLVAALGIATSGAIGAFHAGVEYGWWQGLTACSTSMNAGSTQDVLDAIMAAPLTRCDVAPWSLFDISLAGYNALFSLAASAIILLSLLRWNKDRS